MSSIGRPDLFDAIMAVAGSFDLNIKQKQKCDLATDELMYDETAKEYGTAPSA